MKKCSVFGGKNTREKKIRTRVFLQKHVCFWGALRKPSTKAFAHLVQGSSVQGSKSFSLRFKVQIFKESSELLNYDPRTLNFFTTSQFYNFTT
ncbi:hypothetical protein D1003_03205 [Riemerella anatipestifer]|nr:hypothetical protein [Riemerella anatipestifer]